MKRFFIFAFIVFIFVSTSFAFSDDANFSWANDAIDKWSSKGYVSGYPDGTFRGNNYITRAEVIAIINKLNNSKVIINKRAGKDIFVENWFFDDIGRAVEAGLINVDVNGNIRPNDYATREEVMIILSKLLNISYSGNLDNAKVKRFIDSSKISTENYKRVAGIVEEGFVNGYLDNTLRPSKNITRAEFMCILNNSIKDVYTSGCYNNKSINGNIIINGNNVEITNSEIKGKVFVLDGAAEVLPKLINTKVSGGVNSRVGNVLIKNIDALKTLSEYNDEKTEYTHELAFAKLSYSKETWTNDDVKVTVKLDDKNYEIINGDNKLIFEKNGEKEIEFEHEGEIVRVKVGVSNIDKIIPKITASVQSNGTDAVITVEVEEDGLSPIKEICCNGVTNKPDIETGVIVNTFTVTQNGKYTIKVTDEAGNVGQAKVEIKDIGVTPVDVSGELINN